MDGTHVAGIIDGRDPQGKYIEIAPDARVLDIAVDENDQAIVQSVIALGHQLGLEIVAEGVEDEQTLQLLTRLACDTVQGFYLARPMPAQQLTRWLRESRWGSADTRSAAA